MIRRFILPGLWGGFGLLVACASTTPTPLYNAPTSAEWVKFLDAHNADYYYDPASIHSYVSFRDVWELVDFKTRGQKEILSALALVEYDCYNSRTRIAKFAGYSEHMAEGRLVHVYERGKHHLWWDSQSSEAGAEGEHVAEQLAEHIRIICQ